MFVMCYFRTRAEALHLAASDDGLVWRALNSNRPVLEGTLPGRKPSLRDPFVFRDETGRFHLLATNGWQSDSIVHAVSNDLLQWSEQRLLPVMAGVPGVRNCWAPECFRDVEAGVYRLIWSSSTTPSNTPSDWNHRIWQTTTTDFATFTPAELFWDPGYSVIDATVARAGDGRYLLAFKDERGTNAGRDRPNGPGTVWKAIRVYAARSGSGPWIPAHAPAGDAFITPSLTEGPALFRRKNDRWTMIFDHFMEERYSAVESADEGRTWQPVSDSMTFPPGLRHAGVLEVDDPVYANLLRQVGPEVSA